jgi:hypothetical protein
MIAILRFPVKTHWESQESRISLPKISSEKLGGHLGSGFSGQVARTL